jgi:hypothetical protein
MKGKVNCTCGWSWNKSDSSKKDMYICHECGRDNSNNMKNGGWLDNYNDSQASAPEGMVGDGFSNVGRNYSPAWGGQFQEGGEIPKAQVGTRADSIALYNNSLAKIKFYKGNPDYEKFPIDKFSTDFKNPNTRKKLIKDNYNENVDKSLVKQVEQSAKESKKPLTTAEKLALRKQIGKPKFGPVPGTNLNSFGDVLSNMPDGYYNPLAPPVYLHPNISPQGSEYYSSSRFGDASEIPYYDPIAILPFDILKEKYPQLVAGRIKKYGTKGIPKSYLNKDKPEKINKTEKINKINKVDKVNKVVNKVVNKINKIDKVVDKQRPKVEALQPLTQQGAVSDFSIDAQLPVIRPEARMPKSFDVNSQRQTMSGPSEYYNYSDEGIDINDAVRAKESADTYNQYIKEKYEEAAKSNPKAQKRLEQLMQNVELTPNYQMGGNVYPVNYVPQAQDGISEDAMRGMMKSKIGMGNAFEHPAIKRMSQAMPKTGMTPEGIGTHYMSSVDNYAVPELQDLGEEKLTLVYPDSESREAIKFNSPEEAEYFAKHYKEVAPMSTTFRDLNSFQSGGSIPGSVGFTYARTKGIPSNGPYAKKTMASAQNGQEMRYYQNGLDWKPKGMKDGGWLDGYDEAQEGKRVLPNNRALQILADIQKRKQKGIPSPQFSNVKIKDERAEAVKKVDNTRTSSKPKFTDLKKINVRNKTKAELAEQERKADEAIAAKRKAVREKADANVLNQWSTELFDSDNWTRQNLEDAGAGLESKFRLSDEPNFFDDYINPASWVGRMSANLGAAPNQIVQQDSMMPLVSSIAEPVLGGAIGEVVGPYISKALRPITRPINEAISPVMKKAGNLFGKQKGKGPNYRLITDEDLSLSDFNKASKQQIKSIGEKNVYKDVAKSESKRHQDLMRDIEEYGEGWKYLDDDIASSAKQAADAKAEWTNYLDAQEANIKTNPEYFNNTPDELVYYKGKGLGKEELEQLAKEQVDQWYGIQEYKGTRPNTKGYISDVDDYIGDPKYMLPGNRFNREAMLRDMGDDAMNSFNKMYKNQNWKPNIGDIPLNKQGGVIKSDRGQWDHPGKITRIKGGNITMKKDPKTGKALTEPLLGIADTGEQQWMYPEEDYNFEGANYVTEIPKSKLAKNGIRQEQKGLVNLDQLTNFTNYNKPTVGGWLSKYN